MPSHAHPVGFAVLAATLTAFLAPSAHGQCPAWVDQPVSGLLGVDGTITDQVLWDPDGPGPQFPVLVIGGNFTIASNVLANGVAMWNGTTWASLGGGVSGRQSVTALAVYNGDLIAAGSFNSAGGLPVENIASWDGTAWHPLESGTPTQSTQNTINALAVYNGDLYAAGAFAAAGGSQAEKIARWNGSEWSPLIDGTGANGITSAGDVFALRTYAGKLIVGGNFTIAGGTPARGVVAWDGTNWEPLGDGVNNAVTTLNEYNGALIVGGRFTTATNPGGTTISANRIASWNGAQWSGLGNGVSASAGVAVVTDVAVYGDELISTGNFQSAGTLPPQTARNVARWNGTEWNTLGTGFDFRGNSLAVFGGSLYAGGDFTTAGDVSVDQFARWDGAAWNASGTPGFNSTVTAFGAFNGELIAGGFFSRVGTTATSSVARFSGGAWQPLGAGLDNAPLAFTNFGSSLIVGGNFTTAGGTTVSNIAAWNGSAWSDLGGGLDGTVSALDAYAGELIAAGAFTAAGATPASAIARWNTTTWQPLAGGVDGSVTSLATYGGSLVVGGSFASVDNAAVAANSIASWNGAAWSTLGAGIVLSDGFTDLPGFVNAVKVFGGDLIAAGTFNLAGGTPVKNIARWNGSAWSAMGDGLGDPDLFDSVNALEVYNGELYATGTFTVSGTDELAILARWDAGASDWVPVSTPGVVGGGGFALFATAGELHLGGLFASVGNTVSVNWARLASSPVVVMPPADLSVSELATINLSVRANGAPTLSYLWRRNGSPISNGPAGASVGGGTVSGATSATLAISDARRSDSGSYTVTISNSCGILMSPAASVTVLCRADFNGAGGITVQDIFDFLAAYFAGSPSANFNNAGGITVQDIFDFLTAYFAGC